MRDTFKLIFAAILAIVINIFVVFPAFSQTVNQELPLLPKLDYETESVKPDLPPTENYEQYNNAYHEEQSKQFYSDNSKYESENSVTQLPEVSNNTVYRDYEVQSVPNNAYSNNSTGYSAPYTYNYQQTPPQTYQQNTPGYSYSYRQQPQYDYYSQRNSRYESSRRSNALKSAVTYGAIGAGSGALFSSRNRGRNAAIGAGIGAVLGLFLGR